MASVTSQDLGTALDFPFKDSRWTIKLAIAKAIMLAGFIIHAS